MGPIPTTLLHHGEPGCRCHGEPGCRCHDSHLPVPSDSGPAQRASSSPFSVGCMDEMPWCSSPGRVRGGSGVVLVAGGGLFRALFKGSWFPLIGFWLLKEAKKRWRSVIGSRMVGGLGALSNPYSFFFGCAGGALQIRFLHNLPSIKSPVTSNWDYRSTLINLWLWVKTETP